MSEIPGFFTPNRFLENLVERNNDDDDKCSTHLSFF